MKKKWLALVLALAMSLGLAACGGDTGGSAAPTPATGGDSSPAPAQSPAGGGENSGDYSDLKIAVLLAGPANDNGWNATAFNALTAVHDKYGLKEELGVDMANSFYRLGGYHRELYRRFLGDYEGYQQQLSYQFVCDFQVSSE